MINTVEPSPAPEPTLEQQLELSEKCGYELLDRCTELEFEVDDEIRRSEFWRRMFIAAVCTAVVFVLVLGLTGCGPDGHWTDYLPRGVELP